MSRPASRRTAISRLDTDQAVQAPFDSEQSLRGAFAQGLDQILDHGGMGAHILALANALFDPDLHAHLNNVLRRDFAVRADACRRALGEGQEPGEAADDLLVFLKLMALNGACVERTRLRMAGPWEVQFNLLRSFRPQRMSTSVGGGAQAPFDADGFHFNKPFLRQETLWRGWLQGHVVDLLYNKFPFLDLHGLLVPDREECHPQFLTRGYHRYTWELCMAMAEGLPGVGFGYNSYGAYASVNHMHLQMFVRENGLPVEHARWIHNGGMQDYPAACLRFDQVEKAWAYLDYLHREAHPYNLLYRPGLMYCLPRARQGDYEHSDWSGGYAWYEMAGGVVAFNLDTYETLDETSISTELGRVGVMN